MNDKNVEIITDSVNTISKISFDLLSKIDSGDDVDIHTAVYKINQEAPKVELLLNN